MSGPTLGGYGSTSRDFRDDPAARLGQYHDDPHGFGGGRSGGHRSYQSAGYGSFNELCDYISSNIFKVNNNATSLERALKQIGTSKDSVMLRDRMHATEQDTNQVITETAMSFRRLNALCTKAERQQKLQYERLKNEFQDSAQRYNTLQKRVAERVKAAAFSSLPLQQELISWTDDPSDQAKLLAQEQQRQQLQAQLQDQDQLVDTSLALIAEREERIIQLESDILDINEIFRDLGTMVHEQGETIDTIEANVEAAHGQVEAGNEQLVQASKYQRKYRKKMCILVIVLSIIAAIIILIIVLSLKKK